MAAVAPSSGAIPAPAAAASSGTEQQRSGASGPTRREIYTYKAPWPCYGLAASNRPGAAYSYRFALGSFVEEYANKVQIIQLSEEVNDFVPRVTFDHPYPTTKIAWAPERLSTDRDLLATSGDYMRIWNVLPDAEDVRMEALLNNNKANDYCSPLTSFDWNVADHNVLAQCSIDTTVTVWDVPTKTVRTQLIAHDKEVYDVAFQPRHRDIFGTVGADGSLRTFDLRDLEHSTIMYEAEGGTPLLRLYWNQQDENFLATVSLDSAKTAILDIRVPSRSVAELPGHCGPVNAAQWAPHSGAHICTAGDDNQALIWDLSAIPKPIADPILAYTADAEINNMIWASSLSEWVAITYDDKFQLLRV